MSSYDEAREAAFAQVMGSIDMPDDNTAEYDEWLFNVAIDAFLAKLSETHAVVPRRHLSALIYTSNMALDKKISMPPPAVERTLEAIAMLAQEVKP